MNYTITYAEGLFTLWLAGKVVLTGRNSMVLSKYAFSKDADSVRHDYNLALNDP